MNGELPLHIETALMNLGVITSTDFEGDVLDEPRIPHKLDFNMPNLDENGEPDF